MTKITKKHHEKVVADLKEKIRELEETVNNLEHDSQYWQRISVRTAEERDKAKKEIGEYEGRRIQAKHINEHAIRNACRALNSVPSDESDPLVLHRVMGFVSGLIDNMASHEAYLGDAMFKPNFKIKDLERKKELKSGSRFETRGDF